MWMDGWMEMCQQAFIKAKTVFCCECSIHTVSRGLGWLVRWWGYVVECHFVNGGWGQETVRLFFLSFVFFLPVWDFSKD